MVNIPYAGKLPEVYAVGKPFTIPGGNSEYEALITDQVSLI